MISLLLVSSSNKDPKVSDETNRGEGKADRIFPCSKIRLLVIGWKADSRLKKLF
ncbi:MAG: hypothetical protein WC428_02900 [Candidatus Paceibacterota bacterium]|jgi:hypothetical protein